MIHTYSPTSAHVNCKTLELKLEPDLKAKGHWNKVKSWSRRKVSQLQFCSNIPLNFIFVKCLHKILKFRVTTAWLILCKSHTMTKHDYTKNLIWQI